jgi:hypothetical protein
VTFTGSALALLPLGLVFPLHNRTPAGVCSCPAGAGCSSPAKHPRTPSGLKDATTDPEVIADWGRRWPGANLGLTGGQKLVVDLDGPAAVEAWRALLSGHGRVPTLTSVTARGYHLLFWQPAGEPLGNTAGKIAHGIDTRGAGGYIVAPGSIHVSGHRYAWVDRAVPVAPCPDWLEALLRPQAAPARRVPSVGAGDALDPRTHRYLSRAVAGEVQRVLDAAPGQRNNTLCQASFSLGQLVGAGSLNEAAVSDALTAAAEAIGLSSGEASATIRSGMTAGAHNPRSASA